MTDPAQNAFSFGPFKLIASERLLTKGDTPVELGARAFDILIALISTPNEVVTKKDLMSRVWPDVTVEEGSLRFHMTSLRKALGDGKDGARYITTLAGRGYCFVAPVLHATRQRVEAVPAPSSAGFTYANLPPRLSRMVGRADDVQKLSAQLSASRLVTIVGPGGVGKTTVALAVAHDVTDAFAGSVLFADLGMLNEPKLATTAISSMLGLSVQSDDATPGLIAFLRGKRILLVLDTCEHLVDAVAGLAAGVLEAAPQVHILATSREALRTEGEHIYRLDALTFPPDDAKLTAESVRQYPATQLFLDRAAASGLNISDADAPLVADICRKLDGVPLAIELTARRVELYGIQQTAALLDQHLSLLWQGSRTAPARQKTLQATLNWSYELLSDVERMVLRRLSVFVGHFTLDAALEVASGAPLDRTSVTMAIDSLVEKSMVAVRPIGAMVRYRLLDTTRTYALETDTDVAGRADLAVRHAAYFRHWLKQTGDEWESLSTGPQRAPFFANLNNVRAALEWCFGESGDVAIGVELAAAATPVFLAMSLLSECQRWSERALGALDDQRRGGEDEMQLQAGFGIATMFMRGNSDPVLEALNRSLAIAEKRKDATHMAGMLGMVQLYHLRGGDYRNALRFAERSAAIAGGVDDPRLTALAHSLLGIARHLVGDLDGARTELEAALGYESGGAAAGRVFYFGFDQLTLANAALATTLWLQGYPVQASVRAMKAAGDAERTNHPLSLSNALTAITVLLWIGELDAAEQHLDWFISRADTQYFRPYLDVGRGLKGELAIRRGDVAAGVETLRDCLKNLQAARFGRFTARFNIFLARGLADSGRFEEAVVLIDETIELIEAKGGIPYTPELLRLKGSIILSMPKPRTKDAEACFRKSIELSRDNGSRFWELRTATDLASLWASQKRAKDARSLLLPVFEQFSEGLDTPDLKAAERVLKALR